MSIPPKSASSTAEGDIVISYVIGAYNSESIIKESLLAIAERLAGTPSEIIVVENGSTDRTAEILAEMASSWSVDQVAFRPMTTEKGLGTALRAGIAASTGSVVVIADDDLPFGFDDLDGAAGVDLARRLVVVGSKAHADSVIERSWIRGVLSGGFRLWCRLTLGMKTGDPQGAFVVNGAWLRGLLPALSESGFLATTEIAYAAELAGVRPVEVPVSLRLCEHETRIRLSDIRQMGLGMLALRRRRRVLRDTGVYAPRSNTKIFAPPKSVMAMVPAPQPTSKDHHAIPVSVTAVDLADLTDNQSFRPDHVHA